MEANRTTYGLKSELTRYSLPSTRRDPNQKLAWVNSICLLFLLIGIFGASEGVISIKPVPPIHQIVPVVLQPTILPPQTTVEKKQPVEENVQPRVVVALPSQPNIRFSVPTIGTLIAPAALASAPPLNPMQTGSQVGAINDTGAGGDRPHPQYPQMAIQHGEQGAVVLMLSGDAAGNIVSVDIKESSGFPYLDQYTVAFVKNHWRLPTNLGTHIFQTTIKWELSN
jgi:TonB family protein